MRRRLDILAREGLGLPDIEAAIGTIGPLDGARAFLDWARERFQVLILSDTFYEFARPLMRKLGWPTLFCNRLVVGAGGRIEDYRLRQKDQKRESVRALHALHFQVIAAGDSYNDTSMLSEADAGILFRPPERVAREFPQFPVTRSYEELRGAIERAADALGEAGVPSGRPAQAG
jgi:phosphoserine/homoserine phosphotransferase